MYDTAIKGFLHPIVIRLCCISLEIIHLLFKPPPPPPHLTYLPPHSLPSFLQTLLSLVFFISPTGKSHILKLWSLIQNLMKISTAPNLMKIGIKGFSGMLITNLELDLSLLEYFVFSILWPVNSTRIEIEGVFCHFTT